MKKKSIKGELIKKLSVIFATVILAAFTGTHIIVNKSLTNIKNTSLQSIMDEQSKVITEKLEVLMQTTKAIATDDVINNMDISFEDKLNKLNTYTKELNIRSLV